MCAVYDEKKKKYKICIDKTNGKKVLRRLLITRRQIRRARASLDEKKEAENEVHTKCMKR